MPELVEYSVAPSAIDGLHIATLKAFTDERGTIREFFRASAFAEVAPGIGPWAQINATETNAGSLRGMHGEAMTKLVAVVSGAAHGAWVDTRPDSPTRGAVVQTALVPGVQVLVPQGVCNGFQALEDGTQYLYCFDQEWVAGMAGVAVNPLDPALGIDWPIPVGTDDLVQVSAKDRAAPLLANVLGEAS